MQLIRKYFPELSPEQDKQLAMLPELYSYWNERINVISRKDIENLEERHILHSLAIAKIIQFKPGTRVLDVGTGGGFPGIPLAILFPDTQFVLVDSVGKKIKVVNEIVQATGLRNVMAHQVRAEEIKGRFDFVVSRAVAKLPVFTKWVRHKIAKDNKNTLGNGILYLKGGDLEEELNSMNRPYAVYDLDINFQIDFFHTKKLVYVPLSR
ncbi:MAG: 16S rRNA (guanine(527)-N(7))-methyltransferase RsmG [Bacteroidota bacterium]